MNCPNCVTKELNNDNIETTVIENGIEVNVHCRKCKISWFAIVDVSDLIPVQPEGSE